MAVSNKTKKRRRLALIVILLLMIAVVGSILWFLLLKDKEGDNITYSIESRIQQYEEALTAEPEGVDTYGWLWVQGTNIDYPVIKKDTTALIEDIDYVWINLPLLEGGEGARLSIYGHNMLNLSSQPLVADPSHSRFEQLMSFAVYDFAKENLYFQYTDETGDHIYKIYAVNFESPNVDDGFPLVGEEKVKNYIAQVRENSIYDYDVDVNENDDLISLITCTRYFGTGSNKTQFKIDGRKLREDEIPEKYDVEMTDNYVIMVVE